MKKILLTAATVLLVSTGVASAKVDNTGCGLGSMVFEGRSGVVTDVLAATTNGSFGNQTFGMSSGTSGCIKNAPIQHRNMTTLVSNNYETFALSAAKADSQSEIMISAAKIMEVSPEHLAKVTHDNFNRIFTDGAQALEIAIKIKELI